MFSKLLRLSIPALFVFAIFVGFEFSQADKIQDVMNKTRVIINNQIIVAEVVKEPKDHEQGLSGRESIRINEGMLFIFKEKGHHLFWMKDMNFPIDIVWIDGNEIVGVDQHVQPEPDKPREELTIYSPPERVDKVLELKAGRFTILGASVGEELRFEPLVPNALVID